MFDRVEITVRGGDGGNGVVSFRREKFVPYGGPDGGNGGAGGDVIIQADPAATSLAQFRHRKRYRAGDGRHGQGKKKHGKRGGSLILAVPPGTVVWQGTGIGDSTILADLEAGEEVVVASGGKGGWGNAHFVSATNQVPRLAQKGEAGEEKSLVLELKLIADVGIIGYPNVGKSTLLAAASKAKPEIANYPFTTRQPVLGVVEVGAKTFVLAEVPGLVVGAHLGRGLGHDFLRHVARTKLLIHLIDGTSPSPVDDMAKVNNELTLYDSALGQRRQLVAINKIDLPEVRARRDEIENSFAGAGVRVFFVSAATKEGVLELMSEAMRLLTELSKQEMPRAIPKKVFRPQPKVAVPEVRKEGDGFVVVAPDLERLFSATRDSAAEVQSQVRRQLRRRGIAKALVQAGIKPGDRVRCGNVELEWR